MNKIEYYIKKVIIKVKGAFLLKRGKRLLASDFTADRMDIDGRKLISIPSEIISCRLSDRLNKCMLNASGNLKKNAKYHAGKQLSFYTSADSLFIQAIYSDKAVLSNMDSQMTSCIEIQYTVNDTNCCELVTPKNIFQMVVKKGISLHEGEKRICVFLPSYASLSGLKIILDDTFSIVKKASRPIVFYGSSITQGCAATSPSKNYANLVADYYHAPIVNLGFSESAHAEKDIIEYVASFDAKVFIIEYDHNSSFEEFNDRHLTVYKTLRQYSDSAIIFMSRFSGGLSISYEEEEKRIGVITKTLEYAKSINDNKVYFLNGKGILKRAAHFVDDRHPNDIGMRIIADSLIELINKEGIIGRA